MSKSESPFLKWLLAGSGGESHQSQSHAAPWWKVMCLTGVDYFSSLGYAPGIAFLAAGVISPFATVVLVALMVFGALPMYHKVAEQSPHGQGSIAMLEHLLPGWGAKVLVLVLLGFAGTDFIITITLSAADAAAHIAENHYVDHWGAVYPAVAMLQNKLLVTCGLIAGLGAIFLKGFREAIGVAAVLVFVYLTLNLVVCATGCYHVYLDLADGSPELINDWLNKVNHAYASPLAVVGYSLLTFPELALGMSGFETGVAVMPHVRGLESDTHENPAGRIANTKKLLTCAALIMSFFLCVSSFMTVLLIPDAALREGGAANGRALAYVAHEYLGNDFGTLYDISTISILWFAGASAMAGLLSLVPRYLPRYGMAPSWAQYNRPLVCFFIVVALYVTWYFKASVDAQGAAYATGVLVLMSSAAFAVLLSEWGKGLVNRSAFLLIFLIFSYTTVVNMIKRPEGVHIAMFFICSIFFVSISSRFWRATELRIGKVVFDDRARLFLDQLKGKTIRLFAHRPGDTNYADKENHLKQLHNLGNEPIVFVEVTLADASDFADDVLEVQGVEEGRHNILRCTSPAVPNALAATLIEINKVTGKRPHIYLEWTEGNPIAYIFRYIFLGEGETAPVLREILREQIPEVSERPRVHVA